MGGWGNSRQWQLFDDDGRRKYLTTPERDAFLSAAERMEPRVHALAILLAYTGCRVSEAMELKRHQLDSDRLEVTLRTLKKRRVSYRVVPVPQLVIDILTALPTTHGDRLWAWHRVTAWRRIKVVMSAAGIVGPASCPKGLRHGFGHRAHERNVLPILTQKWMGHADVRTTMIYSGAVGPEERAFASRMW